MKRLVSISKIWFYIARDKLFSSSPAPLNKENDQQDFVMWFIHVIMQLHNQKLQNDRLSAHALLCTNIVRIKNPSLEAFCFFLLLTTWTCVYKLVCFAHFLIMWLNNEPIPRGEYGNVIKN